MSRRRWRWEIAAEVDADDKSAGVARSVLRDQLVFGRRGRARSRARRSSSARGNRAAGFRSRQDRPVHLPEGIACSPGRSWRKRAASTPPIQIYGWRARASSKAFTRRRCFERPPAVSFAVAEAADECRGSRRWAAARRWWALTRWFFRRDNWPSLKSGKREKSHICSPASPRMESPRNSRRSLSARSCSGSVWLRSFRRGVRWRWSYGLTRDPGARGPGKCSRGPVPARSRSGVIICGSDDVTATAASSRLRKRVLVAGGVGP